jgi:energy-coupling factor transport system ATP-binding protein
MENATIQQGMIVRKANAIATTCPAISVRDLGFSFLGKADQALKNVTFDVYPGEFVVVTGPSGCGKSTLAMALGGYIPHVIEGEMTGEVFVKGMKTADSDLSDLAVCVSLCQQDPESQLCTLSVFDEVSFGPENLVLPAREAVRRVDSSLAAVNSGYLKDRGINELSGGEKQRVAIASMLAMGTDVLILDEPTSSLDPDSAHDVLLAIEMLSKKDITIIVIEHKLDRLLASADRLIVMDAGRIVMDGAPATTYPKYREMLGKSAAEGRPQAAPPTEKESIRVEGLKFSYGDREVLRGVSFRACRGELVGIIGPNGSGKSTFLSCLTGLNRPASGKVRVEGMDATKARTSEIARKVGFVFQNPNHQIFENTVLDEVAFACRNFKSPDPETSAKASMEKYGILPYAAMHPLRLSHGEKRRLNLCSVLPYDPDVIILDEPFVGQDMANMGTMLRDIFSLKGAGKTILMVSHDMDIVYRYCDRVVLFDDGRILADDVPGMAVEKIRAAGKMNFLCGGLPGC